MEREADEFVDFRESARFRVFPAGDSELRKWTVSRSAAKLPLQRLLLADRLSTTFRLSVLVCGGLPMASVFLRSVRGLEKRELG